MESSTSVIKEDVLFPKLREERINDNCCFSTVC